MVKYSMDMPMVVSDAPNRRRRGSLHKVATRMSTRLMRKVMVRPLPMHLWAFWVSPLPWQRLR